MWESVKSVLKIVALIALSFCVAMVYGVIFFWDSIPAKDQPKESILAALIFCLWISFYILFHKFRFSRLFFCAVAVGVLWLCFGKVVLAPFWMALMYSITSLVMEWSQIKNQRDATWPAARTLLILIAGFFYSMVSPLLASKIFLVIFGVVTCAVIVWHRRGLGIARVRLEVEAPPNVPSVPGTPPEIEVQLDMLDKAYRPLPASTIRELLVNIIASAGQITQSMKEDCDDIAAGRAFLERYIPYVQKIVDDQLRMQRHKLIDQTVNQQTEQALVALLDAFEQQYLELQKNNQQALSVDLSVLNSLLKIDGFK